MNGFKYQHSQVLQLIYEAGQGGFVNEEEKKQMKSKKYPNN
jgi:hypothetical protein